jgi:hypothetical protein
MVKNQRTVSIFVTVGFQFRGFDCGKRKSLGWMNMAVFQCHEGEKW